MHLDIGHLIVSSIIHGLIYDVIFKVTRHMCLADTALVAVAGIAAVWAASRIFGSRRG